MSYLGGIQEILEWVHSVYGAVSTLLIVLVVYQAYLLRRSQAISESTRIQLTEVLEHNVAIQVEFVMALTELRIVIERTVDGKD